MSTATSAEAIAARRHCVWKEPGRWTGRIDDPADPDAQRWHQRVTPWDGAPPVSARDQVWFIGCCTDVGVSRNKGRPGAAAGPASIRRALANLPASFGHQLRLIDAGDLMPQGDDLEGVLEALADMVAQIVAARGFPVVLGGGHEIAYGHHRGLVRGLGLLGRSAPRIRSFDAHFDVRPEGPEGARVNSGNMFRLLALEAEERGERLDYAVIGIQQSANTASLYRSAAEVGCRFLPAVQATGVDVVLDFIDETCGGSEAIHATLCVDVMSAAHAPAVSAPQPFGLDPSLVLEGLRRLARSGLVAGLDVAEVSPRYAGDDSTAHLVAVLLFAWIHAMAAIGRTVP